MPPARVPLSSDRLCVEILDRILAGSRFASDVIADVFRRERGLSDAERAEIAESVRAVLRHLRRIDFALDVAGDLRLSERNRRRLMASRVLGGSLTPELASEEEPRTDWLRVASVAERIARLADPLERWAITHSLPDWIARRLRDQYGSEADALACVLNEPPPRTLRVNSLRTSRSALRARLMAAGIPSSETSYSEDGLVLEGIVNPFALESFHEGLFELQDEASQLGALAVAPPPRGTVVDTCAGGGGKTLAVAALMRNKGRILALDSAAARLNELRRRARRAGAHQIRAIEVATDCWPDSVAEQIANADRILIDAPCSGTGTLRRNPEAKWSMCEADLARLQETQFQLVERAVQLLRRGARIVYSTCSLLRSENEELIERVLRLHPDLEIMSITKIWGRAFAAPISDSSGTFLKLTPHHHNTDGFFAAVLRRP